MAVVKLYSTIGIHKSKYLGLSTDEKPTDADAGSKFVELDTKKGYLFEGTDWYCVTGTTWQEIGGGE